METFVKTFFESSVQTSVDISGYFCGDFCGNFIEDISIDICRHQVRPVWSSFEEYSGDNRVDLCDDLKVIN